MASDLTKVLNTIAKYNYNTFIHTHKNKLICYFIFMQVHTYYAAKLGLWVGNIICLLYIRLKYYYVWLGLGLFMFVEHLI